MIEGWREIRLNEIAKIYSGFAFKSKEMTSAPFEGIPLVKIKNIFDRKVSQEFDSYLKHEFLLEKHKKYKLHKGDVLVAMTGQGSVGRIGKMHEVIHDIYVNQRVGIVRVNNNLADKEFVYQQMANSHNESVYFNLAMGAGQPNLSPKDIGNLKINLPPLPTQRKIASFLSAYDDLIENNLKRIKLLEEKAQLTYEEWFVRMKFPGHETTPMNAETGLPEGWEKLRLKEISDFKYGKMPKKEKVVESGYSIFSGYRITGNYSEVMFKEPTLIVVARGVGGTGDVKLTPPNCWLTNLSIAVLANERTTQNYLYYLLKDSNLRSLDSGAAQSQITITSLENIQINHAKIELQIKFDEVITTIFKEIQNLKTQNQLLKEARDILLPRLMTGMIDVEQIYLETLQTTTV